MSPHDESLILYRLDELKSDISALSEQVRVLGEEHRQQGLVVEGLKIKSGVWGAVGGAIPTALAALYWLFEARR
jgi:hypothetical protein